MTAIVTFLVLSSPLFLADPAYHAFGDGALTAEEKRFLEHVISELRSTELARRWIAGRRKSATPEARAELEVYLADCLAREGKLEEYKARLRELQRSNPTPDPGISLKIINAEMAEVLRDSREARRELDATRCEELLAARDRRFETRVLMPLAESIEGVESRWQALKEQAEAAAKQVPAGQKPERDGILDARVAEQLGFLKQLSYRRIELCLMLADEVTGERAEAVARYFALVEKFADEFLSEYRVHELIECDCLSMLARALAARGAVDAAGERFQDILDYLDPEAFEDLETVDDAREIRMKAALGLARMWNRTGEARRAHELFERLRAEKGRGRTFRAPETFRLLTVRTWLEAEEAVSHTHVDGVQKGAATFRGLLARVESGLPDAELARDLSHAVARTLARLRDAHVTGLDAEFLQRAGAGYFEERRYDAAIAAWRESVAARGAGSDPWRERALHSIANTALLLSRREVAADAFLEYLEAFPEGEHRSSAARNALALCGELAADDASWKDKLAVAERHFREVGSGYVAFVFEMQRAARLEADAQGLEEDDKQVDAADRRRRAREIYLGIPREAEGVEATKAAGLFFRARARAARCLGHDGKKAAMDELEKALVDAESAGAARGVAALRLELARLQWQGGSGDAAQARATLEPLRKNGSGDSSERELGLALSLRIAMDTGDLDAAETVFTVLHGSFPEARSTLVAIASLLEAHQERATADDKRRAGELARLYLDHPDTDPSSMDPATLLWIAAPLAEGDRPADAHHTLTVAARRLDASAPPELVQAVRVQMAVIANDLGKPDDAIAALDALMRQFKKETESGQYADAPRVYRQYARALRARKSRSNPRAPLEDALKHLEKARAILETRRLGFRLQFPPAFDREFWTTYLEYLEVLAELDRGKDIAASVAEQKGMGRTLGPEDIRKAILELAERHVSRR